MEKQLQVAHIEEVTRVPQKFRFPFFTEMMWWILDRYSYHLLGRHHMAVEGGLLTRLFGTEEERKTFQERLQGKKARKEGGNTLSADQV